MKINFLLLTITAAAITSCSTAYRTGQTPDDVYYSPARLETHDVRRDRDENTTTDNTVYTSTEDREIRRRIRHRRYRRYDDRYDYPYGYNGPVYGNPKYGTTQNTSEPRKTNLGAYTPNATNTDSANSTNTKLGKINSSGNTTTPTRTFGTPKNSTNGSAVGNLIRRVLTPDNSNNNYNSGNSNNSSSRTFDKSSNNNNNSNNNNSSNTRSSSSDTKTSSTSAPVRTFGKQN